MGRNSVLEDGLTLSLLEPVQGQSTLMRDRGGAKGHAGKDEARAGDLSLAVQADDRE